MTRVPASVASTRAACCPAAWYCPLIWAAVSATAPSSAPSAISQWGVRSAARARTTPAIAQAMARAKPIASITPRPDTRSPTAATATVATAAPSPGSTWRPPAVTAVFMVSGLR